MKLFQIFILLFITIPTFAFTPIITDDCNGNEQGSITFDHFCYDAPNGPFTFTWYKDGVDIESGNTGNGDEIDLLDKGEGSYTLIINDQDLCQGVHPFEIENNPCPEIIVSDPSCGIETNGEFEICVGASIIVKGLANGYSIDSWSFGSDSEVIKLENVVETYEVFWASPGDKTISFTTSEPEQLEIAYNTINVSLNNSICQNSGVSYDFCSQSNVCDFVGNTINYESSCYSINNTVYPYIHYNSNSVPNFGGPFQICAGTSGEVICSNILIASGYVGHEFNFNNPFLGNVYIFSRDVSNGCSSFIMEITDCESCTDGINIDSDPFGPNVFECDILNNQDLIEMSFHVECGSPPYEVSIDPPISLVQYDDFYTNDITLNAMVENGMDYIGFYTITVTDSNGETSSVEMQCNFSTGIDDDDTPTPSPCNDVTTDVNSPVFNNSVPTVYNYCIDDDICIDFDVTETEDGLFAVYVKNYFDLKEVYSNTQVTNAQGQFCFGLNDLSIGSNIVEVMATDKGECPLNHTTQQYTINISDYQHLPYNTDLQVVNAEAINDDFVYYPSNCINDQLYLSASNGYSEYKWYLDNTLITTTTNNQLPIDQTGNYLVVYFDPNEGPCGTYYSEYVFIFEIADEIAYPEDYEPLSYTSNFGSILDANCNVSNILLTINITGGSGNHQITWLDCNSGCNNYSTGIAPNGTKTFTVTDLCTGQTFTQCLKANDCNQVVPCNDYSDCSETDENTDNGLSTDLRISPTVYNQSTTLKVSLEQESNVKIRYLDAMGGSFTNVLDDVVLPAGDSDIPISTVNDNGGVKIFVLETDCSTTNRIGIKTDK